MQQRIEINLVVTAEAEVFVEDPNQIIRQQREAYTLVPHMVIPFLRYIIRFVGVDKYFDLVGRYNMLSERELYILKLVREGKYKEVTIKLDQNRDTINLVMTEELKVDNAARLNEIIVKKGFQEILVKSYDGAISYSQVTMKKQMPSQ